MCLFDQMLVFDQSNFASPFQQVYHTSFSLLPFHRHFSIWCRRSSWTHPVSIESSSQESPFALCTYLKICKWIRDDRIALMRDSLKPSTHCQWIQSAFHSIHCLIAKKIRLVDYNYYLPLNVWNCFVIFAELSSRCNSCSSLWSTMEDNMFEIHYIIFIRLYVYVHT